MCPYCKTLSRYSRAKFIWNHVTYFLITKASQPLLPSAPPLHLIKGQLIYLFWYILDRIREIFKAEIFTTLGSRTTSSAKPSARNQEILNYNITNEYIQQVFEDLVITDHQGCQVSDRYLYHLIYVMLKCSILLLSILNTPSVFFLIAMFLYAPNALLYLPMPGHNRVLGSWPSTTGTANYIIHVIVIAMYYFSWLGI